jgi:hypothetical protein
MGIEIEVYKGSLWLASLLQVKKNWGPSKFLVPAQATPRKENTSTHDPHLASLDKFIKST